MPAFLTKDDWATRLGENYVTPEQAKSCLRTVEGIHWAMNKEERAASKATKRARPTVSDPKAHF
jgi:hypothetical protein